MKNALNRRKGYKMIQQCSNISVFQKKVRLLGLLSLVFCLMQTSSVAQQDITKLFWASLVSIESTHNSHDQYRPWRYYDLETSSFNGVAISENQILTTAKQLTNSAYIKIKVNKQNEYIQATIAIIDYDINLCLLTIDPKALNRPLRPVKFEGVYKKNAQVDFCWLSKKDKVYSGRGFLDHARVDKTPLSHTKLLYYLITNTSTKTSASQLYAINGKAIGIASSGNDNSSRLIPASVINQFLDGTKKIPYHSFSTKGFSYTPLLDPTMRQYLKMPDDIQDGVYIENVYAVGSGHAMLKEQDVIIAIDHTAINAQGRFEDPHYGILALEHLIARQPVGTTLTFTVWREGKQIDLDVIGESIGVKKMAIPYYQYDEQPQYLITGGFMFQQITRQYLRIWGADWESKTSVLLANYNRTIAFNPTDDRKELIILSYVLPAPINQGYQNLRFLVLKSVNGTPITKISDIASAKLNKPESPYDIYEFEGNNPTVVISRTQAQQTEAIIARNYGITQLSNIH
jgi:hypothetical protein